MKKILLVGATLAALVALTIVVDRMSTKDGKPLVKAADTPAPAPEVTFKDLDGKDVTLAQYKGKVVLVNFWATWCGPCRVEIPWLIEFQQKYGPRGFTVLGDRKSTRLNSSHSQISYAVFCLKKKKTHKTRSPSDTNAARNNASLCGQ